MTDTTLAKIQEQLRILLQLTQTEAQISQTRVSQARTEAVRLLARALERARIHGPVTNRDLLVRSLRHPDFVAARLDTGFYDRHLTALTATAPGEDAARRLAATANGNAASAVAPTPRTPLDTAALNAALQKYDATAIDQQISRLAAVLPPLELLRDVLMPVLAQARRSGAGLLAPPYGRRFRWLMSAMTR